MEFLVATDGSSHGEAALEHAIDRAAAMGASLTVVHAVDPAILEAGGEDPVAGLREAEQRLVIEDVDDAERRGAEILEDAVETARNREFEVRTELLHGDPVETISTYAAENDCDGIVVGHRTVAPERDRVLGSVAKGLIDRAPVPVTVVD